MARHVAPDVQVFPDLEALSMAAARDAGALAREAVVRSGRFVMSLAGGSTPRRFYSILAEQSIPWAGVHVFWGDERLVSPDDESSNYHMAREALIDRVPIPASHVHRIRTESGSAETAAATYRTELTAFFELPSPCHLAGLETAFDLTILGVGKDGHTASLFPGSPALELQDWAIPVEAPRGVTPRQRVTLSLTALNASRCVYFLAAGADKAEPVAAALAAAEARRGSRRRAAAEEAAAAAENDGSAPAPPPPAALVTPRHASIWFLDEAAAGTR